MQIPQFINKNRFYTIEQEEFPNEYKICLTKIEAKRFVRKICKHFHEEPITLKFHGKRRHSGSGNWDSRTIRICHNPTVLLLAHELAHIFTRSGHTKRGLVMVEKIVLYSRKKHYWRR